MSYADDIKRLRDDGLTYDEIVEELGCAKSTVSFHLGKGQKKKNAKRTRDRRSSLRKYVFNSKLGKACTDCEVEYPPHVLEYDHVRGEKVAAVSDTRTLYSLELLKAEIEKCELVCANCHRERTYKRSITSGESVSLQIEYG